ncbi:hypothetical protein BJX99DRAFT_244022 [Aspergillus californicus]
MGKRILITGGSGKVTRHVIIHLLSHGYYILKLDIVPLPAPSLSGQVHAALTSRFHDGSPYREPLNQIPDAVIHLAGYPRNMIVPISRRNTQARYNIIETACQLGVKKIIIASAVCVYGPPYAEGEMRFPSFPVEEESGASLMDTYGISKVCAEQTARGFSRRFGSYFDIYILWIGTVIRPDEYERAFSHWRANTLKLKAVGTDGLGYQVFNATSDEITIDTAGDGFTREMDEKEAPLTNRKIGALLGLRQQHPWQKYFFYN